MSLPFRGYIMKPIKAEIRGLTIWAVLVVLLLKVGVSLYKSSLLAYLAHLSSGINYHRLLFMV